MSSTKALYDYDQYVKWGKELVSEVENRQMKICAYAMVVCTIRHGGRSNGFYTMKDYATDIGLNNKTLNQWMLIYRNVVLKLSDKQLETMTWKQASKVNENLEDTNTIENKLKGTPRARVGSKRAMTPAHVQKVFTDYVDEKPFLGEFLSIIKQTKHTKMILQKRDLSIVQDSHLALLMELLDECSDLVNDYLTEKKKARAG